VNDKFVRLNLDIGIYLKNASLSVHERRPLQKISDPAHAFSRGTGVFDRVQAHSHLLDHTPLHTGEVKICMLEDDPPEGVDETDLLQNESLACHFPAI